MSVSSEPVNVLNTNAKAFAPRFGHRVESRIENLHRHEAEPAHQVHAREPGGIGPGHHGPMEAVEFSLLQGIGERRGHGCRPVRSLPYPSGPR